METPTTRDAQHLRMLAMAHYVLAAVSSVCSIFPGGTCCLGVGLMTGISNEPDSEEGGVVLVAASLLGVVLILAYSGLLVLQGFLLARRSTYGLCVALAVIVCLNSPLGTVLGVLTLIVLMRESVKASF